MIKKILICYFLIAGFAVSSAQMTKVASVEGITEYQNGEWLKSITIPRQFCTNHYRKHYIFIGLDMKDMLKKVWRHLLEHMFLRALQNHS